jgi:small subunit ribosomal protein S2
MVTSKKDKDMSDEKTSLKNKNLEKGDVKEESIKKDEKTSLTSLEDYIKTASYLGTKVITPTMRRYIYRRRLDGLSILNTLLVDKKLSGGIDFIKRYKPNQWTLICKREAGWRAAKMFSELTGVRLYTKKYPAGILTNPELDNFIETEMIMICDPWLDKNALADAKNIRIPVIGICDTNNHTADIDVVIIGNNKSNKSLGLFFWLMAREYMKFHGINKELPSLEEFVGEELVLEEPKKRRLSREKKEKDLKSDEGAIEEKMRALAEKADEEAKGEMVEAKEGKTIQVGEKVTEGV